MSEKTAELEQLRAKITALRDRLQSGRQKKSRAERRLQEIEQRIARTHLVLNKSKRTLEGLNDQLSSLQRQKRSATEKIRRQSEVLAREVRAAYVMGRQQQVKLLLNQERPSSVGRTLVYFSYFSRARQEKIAAIQHDLQQLENIQSDIQEKTRTVKALRDEQRDRQAQFKAQKQRRKQILADLTRRLDDQGSELKRLQVDEKQLQSLVQSLQELLSDIPADASQLKPFRQLKGNLRWPASGTLAKRFGSRRGESGLKWQGVLISAPEGGKVRAISQGRVAFADWLRGFGLLLIIDHGDGYMSLYGQNQALYKEVGEWVDSGEVVATLGASGGHIDTGLYFEIRHNGEPVNPLRWCAGKPGQGSG